MNRVEASLAGEQIVRILDKQYPDIKTSLVHENTFQLLVATVLSAQSTDIQVNKVTPQLFASFPDPATLAKANLRALEGIVKPTGFYRLKARRIREIAQKLMKDHRGKVPGTMEELTKFSGVGRKTSNIVLSVGFGKVEGIAVDTHVKRLSGRIGLSREKTPEKIELDLMKITPKILWPRLSMLLILHGRNVCHARKPACALCPLNKVCSYYKTFKKQ